MRTSRLMVAIVVFLVGLVWIGQGTGLIGGSAMSNVGLFAVIGAVLLVATVAIVIATQVDRQPAEKHAPVAGAPSGPSDALKASKADAADAVVPRSERDNAEGQARRDSNAPAGQQVAVGAPLVDSSSAVAEAPRKTQLARANPVPPTPPASAAPASPSTAAAPPPNATAGMAPSTAAPAALPSAARATPPTMQAEAAPAAAGAIVRLPAAPPVATAPPAQAAAEGGEGTTAGAPEPKQEARAKVAQPGMRALAQSEETRVKERAAPARPQANVALAPDAAPGKRLAKARPVERTAAMVESEVENDPARWMERIIALRDAGRDADADRELARLRERYPEMQVPANALRRAGTR